MYQRSAVCEAHFVITVAVQFQREEDEAAHLNVKVYINAPVHLLEKKNFSIPMESEVIFAIWLHFHLGTERST